MKNIKKDILTGEIYISEDLPEDIDFTDEKAKHFARLFASGLPVFRSYKLAGYTGNSPSQASELLANDNIKKMVIYFRNEKGKMIDITEEELIYNLACMATYNPRDYYNDDGQPKNITELTDAQARGIVEFQHDTFEGPTGKTTKIRYKFADKKSALQELLMYKEGKKAKNVDRRLVIGLLEGKKKND